MTLVVLTVYLLTYRYAWAPAGMGKGALAPPPSFGNLKRYFLSN